jgi:hypothetical protein
MSDIKRRRLDNTDNKEVDTNPGFKICINEHTQNNPNNIKEKVRAFYFKRLNINYTGKVWNANNYQDIFCCITQFLTIKEKLLCKLISKQWNIMVTTKHLCWKYSIVSITVQIYNNTCNIADFVNDLYKKLPYIYRISNFVLNTRNGIEEKDFIARDQGDFIKNWNQFEFLELLHMEFKTRNQYTKDYNIFLNSVILFIPRIKYINNIYIDNLPCIQNNETYYKTRILCLSNKVEQLEIYDSNTILFHPLITFYEQNVTYYSLKTLATNYHTFVTNRFILKHMPNLTRLNIHNKINYSTITLTSQDMRYINDHCQDLSELYIEIINEEIIRTLPIFMKLTYFNYKIMLDNNRSRIIFLPSLFDSISKMSSITHLCINGVVNTPCSSEDFFGKLYTCIQMTFLGLMLQFSDLSYSDIIYKNFFKTVSSLYNIKSLIIILYSLPDIDTMISAIHNLKYLKTIHLVIIVNDHKAFEVFMENLLIKMIDHVIDLKRNKRCFNFETLKINYYTDKAEEISNNLMKETFHTIFNYVIENYRKKFRTYHPLFHFYCSIHKNLKSEERKFVNIWF